MRLLYCILTLAVLSNPNTQCECATVTVHREDENLFFRGLVVSEDVYSAYPKNFLLNISKDIIKSAAFRLENVLAGYNIGDFNVVLENAPQSRTKREYSRYGTIDFVVFITNSHSSMSRKCALDLRAALKHNVPIVELLVPSMCNVGSFNGLESFVSPQALYESNKGLYFPIWEKATQKRADASLLAGVLGINMELGEVFELLEIPQRRRLIQDGLVYEEVVSDYILFHLPSHIDLNDLGVVLNVLNAILRNTNKSTVIIAYTLDDSAPGFDPLQLFSLGIKGGLKGTYALQRTIATKGIVESAVALNLAEKSRGCVNFFAHSLANSICAAAAVPYVSIQKSDDVILYERKYANKIGLSSDVVVDTRRIDAVSTVLRVITSWEKNTVVQQVALKSAVNESWSFFREHSEGIMKAIWYRHKNRLYDGLSQKRFPASVSIAICIPTTTKNTAFKKIHGVSTLPFFSHLLPSFIWSIEWKATEFSYRFYLAYDDDDPFFQDDDNVQVFKAHFDQIIEKKGIQSKLDIKMVKAQSVGRRQGDVVSLWNELMVVAVGDGMDYFYQIGDDVMILTKHWAEEFVDTLQRNPFKENFGVVAPLDIGYAVVMTQNFVHRLHFDIFHTWFPSSFVNTYSDNWISTVYGDFNTHWLTQHHVHNMNPSGYRYHPFDEARHFLSREVEWGRQIIRQRLRGTSIPLNTTLLVTVGDNISEYNTIRGAVEDYWKQRPASVDSVTYIANNPLFCSTLTGTKGQIPVCLQYCVIYPSSKKPNPEDLFSVISSYASQVALLYIGDAG